MTESYVVLDEIEHIRKRTGMYAGSIVPQTKNEYVYDTPTKSMVKRDVTYIPALVKIFSEILDNSIDEHKRAPHVLDVIKVDIDGNVISVYDNGRGIPVEKHHQTGKYIATTVFTNLRAGSNFNDDVDQQLIGTNGVGSTLTNVLSSKFVIESADGHHVLKQECGNGMREISEPKIRDSDKHYTRITFTPDYDFFNMTLGLDDDHRAKFIKKVVDAAGCNPKIKFYVNGERIAVKDFEDYARLYSTEVVYEETDDWKVAFTPSDGFDQVSFVNSVETYMGGTHVDYVMYQVTAALREHFKKKHKVDVKPSDLKNHIRVFISCNVNRPKFSSQTKENMISQVSEYKTSWAIADKTVRALIKSKVIESVLSWVEAKALQQELAEAKKANKDVGKANPKHVDKFVDATHKNRAECVLFLTEGDSASGGIKNARQPYMGLFPLRGKPLNVYEISVKDVVENAEFKNIMTIMGLQIGVPVTDVSELRFGKAIITSDADLDGFSIRGILMCMFYKFWPELFDMGVIHILETPLAKVLHNKQTLSFYSMGDLEAWRTAHADEKFVTKYYKGLGSSNAKEWAEYLSDDNLDENLVQVSELSAEDRDTFKLLFSKEKGMTDMRKDWLDILEVA